jgi:ABC-2 type transport system ATP-binding protein
MWALVRQLRASGVTVILTTHYIEEAEEMADRIGVINRGELILVEEKSELMRKLGKKQLTLQLQAPLNTLPEALAGFPLELAKSGSELVYTYDVKQEHVGISFLIRRLEELGIEFKDLQTHQSSLEEIFISLVHEPAARAGAKEPA